MTDKRISELTQITGANLADADEFVVVDTSASETKAITRAELALSLGVSSTDSPTFAGLTVEGDATIDTVDLAAIAESKAVTAVDVFVYDTSKDSDGGAWRKRTQGTSWYNETLNTATRGSRKEFPAVAVIVAESDTVTIYDGDDPDLPMWMVFVRGTRNFIPQYYSTFSEKVKCATGMNGEIAVGQYGDGVQRISFIKDYAFMQGQGGRSRSWNRPISGRNDNTTTESTLTGIDLVGDDVNDVAMTVLPNAPIDPATGLPVPTIAVATNGGVSVIKDDGTVVDITHTDLGYVGIVKFVDGDRIFYSCDASSSYLQGRFQHVVNIPTADTSDSVVYNQGSSLELYVMKYSGSYTGGIPLGTSGSSGVYDILSTGAYNRTFARGDGLQTFINSDDVHYLRAKITSDYNTGHMVGDIKGAFLADTDDTDLVGSGELVTNGTFDADTSGWTNGTNISSAVVSGQVQVTRSGSITSTAAFEQNVTVEVGKRYVVSIDVIVDNNAARAIDNGGTGQLVQPAVFGGTGTFVFYVTATTTTLGINLWTDDGTTSTFDNISVKLVDADRSVNNKGLIVNGTVTRSEVSSGAELVAYSGFSASNYLEQPYNPDLDFGTGDFCVMGWVKQPDMAGASAGILLRETTFNSGSGFGLYFTAGQLAAMVGGTATLTDGVSYDDGTWKHLVLMRQSGQAYLFVNGNQKWAAARANTVTDATATVRVGARHDGAASVNLSLALLRISATVPTAEQIKKIYEDEKVLFQDNAAATLYGTSDAVTALAHDEDTGLLHVGTSAGRSVFQGLRRVDNTANAVTTAISASNGLVVEE